jgi:hypothetical protein
MADCPNREVNAESCPCTNKGCERRGQCCACVRKHREANVLPACLLHLGRDVSR